MLVGGVALDVLGIGRFTEDIDLFVRASPDNIDALRRALRRVWDDPSIDEVSSKDLNGDYPVVRYVAPDGSRLDLIARLGEAFSIDDLDVTNRTYGDTEVRVATPETLFEMKRKTIRLQDQADAQKLKEQFNIDDD